MKKTECFPKVDKYSTIQSCVITLSDGTVAVYTGPGVVTEAALHQGVGVDSIQFTKPEPLPNDMRFEPWVISSDGHIEKAEGSNAPTAD